jgi:hypothetical protein
LIRKTTNLITSKSQNTLLESQNSFFEILISSDCAK